MPVTVRKHLHGKRPSWHIVSPEKGVVGHSFSKRKANISASIRNRAIKNKERK